MTDTPTTSAELQINWENVAPVFWLMVWRGFVVVLGGYIGMGAIVGIAMGLAGFTVPDDRDLLEKVAGILGALWILPAAMWVTRSALRKRYKKFRIALISVAS